MLTRPDGTSPLPLLLPITDPCDFTLCRKQISTSIADFWQGYANVPQQPKKMHAFGMPLATAETLSPPNEPPIVSCPNPALPLVDRLGAVADMELDVNLVLQLVNSPVAEVHLVGNFFVKEAFRQISDDFNLAHRERRMSVRRSGVTRTTTQFSRAVFAAPIAVVSHISTESPLNGFPDRINNLAENGTLSHRGSTLIWS